MKTKRLPIILTICLSIAFSGPSLADDNNNSILNFVGSFLLGKAADAIWNSATGKPDVNELQQRIRQLEQLLGDSSEPMRKLRSQVSSTTTLPEFHKEAQVALTSLQEAVSNDPQSLSHIYVGSVGHLKAIFSLYWGNDGNVSGVYCNPTRDATRIYELSGSNSAEGVLALNEYTDGMISARINLTKEISPAWVIWKGKMHNTDGRELDVIFQRERK
jgi:hypothetical protein